MSASNQGYAAEALELLKRYELVTFEDAHRVILDRVPAGPIRVLDIGAGTGRDAAWFAARGDHVLAVEPTAEMRAGAMALHPSPAIEWLDDMLPALPRVRARGETFDLVWLSAVWMHLDADERAAAMDTMGALVRMNGAMMITLRHGPVPAGRRMFAVTAAETMTLAERHHFSCMLNETRDSDRQAGVKWTALWFVRP
jgi:SAM-dependent methyltransferase